MIENIQVSSFDTVSKRVVSAVREGVDPFLNDPPEEDALDQITNQVKDIIKDESLSGPECVILCAQNDGLMDLRVTHDDIDDTLSPRAVCVAAVRSALEEEALAALGEDERFRRLCVQEEPGSDETLAIQKRASKANGGIKMRNHADVGHENQEPHTDTDVCPACSSDNIANEDAEYDCGNGEMALDVTCHDCSYQWTCS